MKQLLLLSVTVSLFFFSGCKKENFSDKCSQLKEAIKTSNVSDAEDAINWFIGKLSSQTYSQQNLDNLATSISGNCSITVIVQCFSCIQTLPEQSEINISFSSGFIAFQKVIDISYTPDNKMKFVDMHD
ncbi:MAG TPA: hypothetical protein PKC72_13085 [Chitinophagaceae bacterium]|nr:hypothetical protein [Chitinophagaceae bacterium]